MTKENTNLFVVISLINILFYAAMAVSTLQAYGYITILVGSVSTLIAFIAGLNTFFMVLSMLVYGSMLAKKKYTEINQFGIHNKLSITNNLLSLLLMITAGFPVLAFIFGIAYLVVYFAGAQSATKVA